MSGTTPVVSVIIPCYNQGHFLSEAIESVLAQSFVNFEIVVVDDGATDDTAEVAGRYEGVRCLRQVNQGLAAARNAGFAQSTGSYVVFLDADDRFLPSALESGLAAFSTHPDSAFVAGHYRRIGADGSVIEQPPPNRIVRDHYSELLRRNFIAMHGAVMYRRSAFDSVGHFNTSLQACEDYELYLRIARQFPIHCYEKVVAEYRQHSANMTRNPALMVETAQIVLRSQWPWVQGNNLHEEAYRAGLRFWQNYYGVQLSDGRHQRTVVEIVDVALSELSHMQLWGGNLEAPRAGESFTGDTIDVVGWVVGRQATAVAVEVTAGNRVFQHLPLNIERQDVSAHYSAVAGNTPSGFQGSIQVVGLKDFEFSLQVRLEDHSRLPLANIRGRRRWRDSTARVTAPLISVIIPCYNQAHFLGEAIESVVAQSYPHFEIVVVDDGGTDKTAEVAGQYPGILYVRQTNQGVAAARNAGLAESRGSHVVFLDADDRLLPNALEVGLAGFEAHPECAMVSGHHHQIGTDGSLLRKVPYPCVDREYYAEFLRRNYLAMPATVMYRRSIFEALGGFDASVNPCSDYELYLRIARQHPIHCQNQLIAEYRQHGGNMTRNSTLMLEGALAVLRSQWPFVQGNPRYEEAYRAGVRFWEGYYGAQLAEQRDKRINFEVVGVELSEIDTAQLLGRNLETPQPGSRCVGNVLELAGWVVGAGVPAVAIEVTVGGRLLKREAIDIQRPDVAAYYGGADTASLSGFHTWLRLVGLGDQELTILATLQDQVRAPLAKLRIRGRSHESPVENNQPLVSVIIPCYNQAVFLREAIESVLAQTDPRFEVVVVDDGSTDNTEEIARHYPGVQCLRQENQGLAVARNNGFQQSRGDYVVFLDADDRLLPRALEAGLAGFRAHPDCVLVAGHCRLINHDGTPLMASGQPCIERDHYARLLAECYIYPPATVMYRRSVFAAVGGFDRRVSASADYDLYLRIARELPIHCHEQVIVEYRQHGANMTRNAALMLKSNLRVLRAQWKTVMGNAQYRKAYRTGRRAWQDYYGGQVVSVIRGRVQEGQWKPVVKGLPVLLRHHPRGLISLLFSSSLLARHPEGERAASPGVATRTVPAGTVIVAGWFSFEEGHATAGDVLARDVVCEWLKSAGYDVDVAFAPPFKGDLNWRGADPARYSHVLFVCGPFGKGALESQFLSHFAGRRLIGLDLTMLVPLDLWNPFDFLLERDSSANAHPDLVFDSRQPMVPVVGVCLVEPYDGAMDDVAHAAIRRLTASREMAIVNVDTGLDTNSTGLRSAAEIESLLARMDVVVTTRLYGMVLALKNGVPVVVIDPEAGGHKIQRQAMTIGWPIVFNADALHDQTLQDAFDYCLRDEARAKARECSERARHEVQQLRDELLQEMGRSDSPGKPSC